VFISTPDGDVVDEIARGLGEATNNIAEYTAVILGLERASELGADEVTLRSDSQLLVNQLTGRYRVRTEHLRPLHARALGLTTRFRSLRIEHVPRERNGDADRLANAGVDAWLAERAGYADGLGDGNPD
jgi:ribonuclease HI